MIKAFFFDLDGTLLNKDREISPQTKVALKTLKENNYRLFVATARPPLLDRMLSWDKNTLSLFDGGAFYNGGCIQIDKLKKYYLIPKEIVDTIIQNVLAYDKLNIALQLKDEVHAFRLPLDKNAYSGWGITPKKTLLLKNLENIEALETIKILVYYANLIDSTTPLPNELISELNKTCYRHAQIYLTDSDKCAQIMGPSINKFHSVEKIREHFNWQKEDIVVFGDDVNDIEMLSKYPHSVAMGNATTQVQKSAQYVTLDNNNDGIPHALFNILNLYVNKPNATS